MNEGKIQAEDRPLLQTILQQNWENVRHIKNERLTFTNIYAIVTAGALSLLNTVKGQGRAEIFLLLFLWFFSIIGLLTSLRLKEELEECLANIENLLVAVGLETFMAMGGKPNARIRYPQFRWVFPVFYSFTTVAFTILLFSNLFATWVK